MRDNHLERDDRHKHLVQDSSSALGELRKGCYESRRVTIFVIGETKPISPSDSSSGDVGVYREILGSISKKPGVAS